MAKKTKKVDKKFLWVTLSLVGIGTLVFIATSISLYTKNPHLFWVNVIKHLGVGLIGGLSMLFLVSKIHFNFWKENATLFYILGIILTVLVFVPGLSLSRGEVSRWVSFKVFSFQPAELLKFSVIIFLSAWFSKYAKEIKEWKMGFLAFILILSLPIGLLALQPDSSTIILIAVSSGIIYFVRGASMKHIAILFLLALPLAFFYVKSHPYIVQRFKTYQNIEQDKYGAAYQIKKARMTIGSGKMFGRGLGKSVQKFGSYLPEYATDSVFAIFAEENGFVGSVILLTLYLLFTFFGFKIAQQAPTLFSQNIVLGIVSLIAFQAFFNIAAISGLIPLSGFPLVFMSKGGTSLFVTLAALGIVLNVSRHRKI